MIFQAVHIMLTFLARNGSSPTVPPSPPPRVPPSPLQRPVPIPDVLKQRQKRDEDDGLQPGVAIRGSRLTTYVYSTPDKGISDNFSTELMLLLDTLATAALALRFLTWPLGPFLKSNLSFQLDLRTGLQSPKASLTLRPRLKISRKVILLLHMNLPYPLRSQDQVSRLFLLVDFSRILRLGTISLR